MNDILDDTIDIKILEYLGIIELSNETIIVKETDLESYKKIVMSLESSIMESNIENIQDEFIKVLKK